MGNILRDFFSDNNGNPSSIRLMTFLVIIAILIKYLITFKLTYEEVALIIAALTGKVIQKGLE